MLTQQVSTGMPASCLLSPWSSLWMSELLLPQIPPVALRRGGWRGEVGRGGSREHNATSLSINHP